MAVFEVENSYRHNDSGYYDVLCVKRTEKSVWMQYNHGGVYRMKVRLDEAGNEWTVDTKIPKRHWDVLTIQSKNLGGI